MLYKTLAPDETIDAQKNCQGVAKIETVRVGGIMYTLCEYNRRSGDQGCFLGRLARKRVRLFVPLQLVEGTRADAEVQATMKKRKASQMGAAVRVTGDG